MNGTQGNPNDVAVEKAQRKLNWIDALLPTFLITLGLVGLAGLSLPAILGLLLGLAIQDPHGPSLVGPLLLALVVVIVVNMAVHGMKMRHREVATSYFVVAALPAVCIFGFAVAKTQFGHDPILDAQKAKELESRMQQNPEYIMQLKPPVPMGVKAEIRSGIYRPTFTSAQIHAVLVNFGREFEYGVAYSSGTSPDDLVWIADHGEIESRMAVASNRNTPEPVLRKLLTDSNPQVVSAAQRGAAKRLCDAEMLRSIWQRKSDRSVKSNYPYFLASDPDLPKFMAENPCTPPDVLSAMSADSNGNVSYFAQQALAKRAAQSK